jgi:hypothetical protein
MHQKEFYCFVRNKKTADTSPLDLGEKILNGLSGFDELGSQYVAAMGFRGTANIVSHTASKTGKAEAPTRYNRISKTIDFKTIDYEVAHAERMIETFRKGGEIKDIPAKAPLRVEYKNGESVEIAFTDGKYNPNDRIVDFFRASAAAPDKIKIDKVWLSHFVITNSALIQSLIELMKKQTGFGVFLVADNQFVDLKGYGLATQLEGYIQLLPFGKNVLGVGDALEKRTESYVYQRGIDGVPIAELDGPPDARHVWHDKTTVVEYEENGKHLYRIFTGSLNASSNFHSAERQMVITTESDFIGHDYIGSIEGVVKKEPAFAISLPLAMIRNTMGYLTGHTDLEISVDMAKAIQGDLQSAKFNDLKKTLLDITHLKTTLSHKVPQIELEKRVEKFTAFLEWYGKEFPGYFRGHSEVPLRRLLTVTTFLSSTKTFSGSMPHSPV